MSDHEYPMPVSKLVKTLSDICRHQGKDDLVEVLECSNARLIVSDYDNWNGGTYTYRLHLELPVAIFAVYEGEVESVEKDLLDRLERIDKPYDNDHIVGQDDLGII